MTRFLALIFLFALAGAVSSCRDQTGISNDSPTEAYKRLFAAVKSKDTQAIKKTLSKRTIELGKLSMNQYKKTEKEAYENGFTATTFSDQLPSIRDERIKDKSGAIEVWNSKESRWEDLPFVVEDGEWKLALGDAFAGSFTSAGKGRDQIEKEAANTIGGSPVFNAPAANSPPRGNAANVDR